jgi:hypothetical protein
MDLEGLPIELVALAKLRQEVGLARRSSEGRDEVFVGTNVVDDRARLDCAGPADQAGNAERTLPVSRLFALEWRRAAIGPGEDFGAVVRREDDDRVPRHPEVVHEL